MLPKLILSLYDYSGNFSHYYNEDENYEVVRVDIRNGQDARLLKYYNRPVYGIISCPPCTMFSKARGSNLPSQSELLDALSTVDLVMRMVILYNPHFWVLENPFHSRVRHYIGEPAQKVNMSWYGYPCKKDTGLWGNFNHISYSKEDCVIDLKPFDSIKKNDRLTTPLPLGYHFYKANP